MTGPHFEGRGIFPTFYVDFDGDGLQVVFCPHTRAFPRSRLSFVLLRPWKQIDAYLFRYNIHMAEGGGRFYPADGARGDQYGRELGERWLKAHEFLNLDNKSATGRLTATQDQKDAWDHVKGSDVYAQRLITSSW